MGGKAVDIGKAISRAFDLLFKNLVVLAVAMLLAYLVGGITFGILMGPLMAGMVLICLKLVRGDKAEIGDVFKCFDKFGPTFLLFLLTGVAVGVVWVFSLIVAVIPLIGWLIGLLLMLAIAVASPLLGVGVVFALCNIVDKKMELMPAIKSAIERIKVKPLETWLAALVFGVLAGIGSVICGIGLVVSAPIGVLGLVLVYLEDTAVAVQPSISA